MDVYGLFGGFSRALNRFNMFFFIFIEWLWLNQIRNYVLKCSFFKTHVQSKLNRSLCSLLARRCHSSCFHIFHTFKILYIHRSIKLYHWLENWFSLHANHVLFSSRWQFAFFFKRALLCWLYSKWKSFIFNIPENHSCPVVLLHPEIKRKEKEKPNQNK